MQSEVDSVRANTCSSVVQSGTNNLFNDNINPIHIGGGGGGEICLTSCTPQCTPHYGQNSALMFLDVLHFNKFLKLLSVNSVNYFF